MIDDVISDFVEEVLFFMKIRKSIKVILINPRDEIVLVRIGDQESLMKMANIMAILEFSGRGFRRW